MDSDKYIAELGPVYRLQHQDPAPFNTKLLFLTPYGSVVVGKWYPGCEFVAWAPLPGLQGDQKAELNRLPGVSV